VGTQNQGSLYSKYKDRPVIEGAIMTKQLIGLIPLLAACHLDLEMSIDVGLNDIQDQIDDLQDVGDTTGSEPETPSPEEPTPNPEDSFCEIFMNDFHSGHSGDSLFVEWDLEGNSADDTFIALVQDQEVFLFESLPNGENAFEFMLPEESGEYTLFVASGEDPNNPLCAATAVIDVLPFEDDPADPEAPITNETASCFDFHNVTESFEVQLGETLPLQWDPNLFANDQLHVFMYNEAGLPTDIFLEELVENTGAFDLVIPADIEEGLYGLSISSLDLTQCIHSEVFVHLPI